MMICQISKTFELFRIWLILVLFYSLLLLQKMWSERNKTNRLSHSNYTNNFQLLRLKNLGTNLNPEEIASISRKSHDSTPRYDKTPQIHHNKFRIYKQKPRSKEKSESGKTVYQIYNLRSKLQQHIVDSRSESKQTSSEVFSHFGQRGLLKHQKQIIQPIQVHHYPQRIKIQPNQAHNYSQRVNSRIKYQQRKWDMNEAYKPVECNVGSIKSQQFHRQSPLSPGKIQEFTRLTPIIQENTKVENLPTIKNNKSNWTQNSPIQAQQQQDMGLKDNHETPGKNGKGYRMALEKQLVDRLNTRTKYLRYRHNQKLKKTLKTNQSIFVSKQPCRQKTDKFIIKYGDSVEALIRILHHNSSNMDLLSGSSKNSNKNKMKITIQIPQFFHNCPDPFLSPQELQFKGICYFQEVGVIPPELADQCQVKIIKHPQTFMYQYQQKYASEFGHNSSSKSNSSSERSVRKYCINWYMDDSVYLGGIVDDRRDGMGMEWIPGVYIYYGQYKDNFRHGYGIIKYNSMKTYVGTWAYDHYHGYGKIVSPDGDVLESGTYRNSQLKSSELFNELI